MTASKKLLLSTLVLSLIFAVSAFAQQETGQITGTVTDPTGAIVPNAQVTVTSVSTNSTRTGTSGSNGSYTITNLQPGVYDVTTSVQGFSEFKRRVEVTVGSRNTVDIALAVSGGAGTTVEVFAEGGTQVDTTSQTLSQVVNRTQITELPTLTRNPYALVGTAGNVSDADPTGVTSRGAGFAINGQRAASTNILLDGGENVDLFSATVGQQVPLDSVQEFRVITNNFTAEYGRASGGVVNVATRAGTNDLHGSAYWFNRISALASNTYENNANGIPKSTFVRNQPGYAIGGPVVKNKLFFFQSTEWIRVRSSSQENALVLAPQFIAAGPAASQGFFTSLGTLGANTQVLGTLTKADIAALGVTPAGPTFAGLAAGTPVFNRVSYIVPANAGGGDPQDSYMLVGRADWNISQSNVFYGRYALQSQNFFPGTNASSPYEGYNTGTTNFNNNIMLNLTTTLSPSMVNQGKVVFNRLNNVQPLGDAPAGPTLYAQATTRATVGGTRIAFPGYLPFNPGSAIPFGGPQNLYQFYDDISWTMGGHQLRIGGQFIHTRDNRTFGAFQNSVMNLAANGNFRSATTTNNMFENFLTGQLQSFQGAIDPQGKFPCSVDETGAPVKTAACTVTLPVGQPRFSRNNRFNDWAAYAQDSWKVAPRLTLNLGLRYEFFGVQHNIDPSLDANFYYGSGANIFEQIRNGQVFTVPNSPIGSLYQPDRNNFAPRLGFALDVFGNGMTSLRGGYGISYERNFGNVTFNVIQNPPNYAVISLVRGPDVAALPISTSNAGPLAGSGGSKALPLTSLRHVDQNIQNAYAHMYSLAFEHQIVRNTVLALEYSGSRGVHQYSIEDPNRPGSGVVYGGDDPTVNPFSRLNRGYSNLNTRGDRGDSYYNGLNVAVRSTNLANAGLTFNANYTWSHAIDNLSSTFSESSNNFNLGLLDPFNPGLDRGNADFDIRHRVTFSAVWELPLFKNSHGFGRQLLGGWTLAPIFTARTGAPFTIFDCTNGLTVCPRAAFDANPERNGESETQDTGGNVFNYLNIPASTTFNSTLLGISDFGLCTTPGQGPCPFPANMDRRNQFRAPGVWNLDLGVYKSFKFGERVALQLRGEAYNIFNHSNLYIDPTSAEVSSGTVIAKRGTTGAGAAYDERRNLQLGVKIIF